MSVGSLVLTLELREVKIKPTFPPMTRASGPAQALASQPPIKSLTQAWYLGQDLAKVIAKEERELEQTGEASEGSKATW